ncbi:unnamed protein product, partial [Ectocarpus fasciculatus]
MVHASIQVLVAAAALLCYSPVGAFHVQVQSRTSRSSGRDISRDGHRFRCSSTPSALGAKGDDGGGEGGYDKDARVIVVGGSGRVGGSTVRALRQLAGPGLELLVGGRSQRNFVKSVERWRTLPGGGEGYDYSDVKFVELDLGDAASLASALDGCDLVVHTAGPFQRKTRPEVVPAAVSTPLVPYVDVCDDARLAMVAKALNEKSQEAGVSATISAGIWPGIDQLMAVEACEMLGGASEVESIDFSAYTAGTGNAGTTILSATFLILCEKVLGFKDGNEIFHEPASGFKKVDFGQSIGEKTA